MRFLILLEGRGSGAPSPLADEGFDRLDECLHELQWQWQWQ
jgi:hypothetical protein